MPCCKGAHLPNCACPPTVPSPCAVCPQPPIPIIPPTCAICPPRNFSDDAYNEGLSPLNIYRRYKDAVVSIQAEFDFTTSTDPAAAPFAGLSYGVNLETVYNAGNGFFFDQHLIMCPAHLVLAPPNYTLAYNRYPFTANAINPSNLQSNVMTRANRIFVDVSNVNGTGHGYTYQAALIGVYGFGDFALLYIDASAAWNANVPCLLPCHPHLRWACSRRYRAGVPVYAIGNVYTRSLGAYTSISSSSALNGNQGKGLSAGIISNHRHVDHPGFAPQELVTVDLDIHGQSTGQPLINAYGHVIGMVTMNKGTSIAYTSGLDGSEYIQTNGDGYVAGPSSWYMLDIVKILLSSITSLQGCPDCVQIVSDPVGDYLRYVHGFLGLAWEVVDAKMYMSHRAQSGLVEANFDSANPGQYLMTPPSKKEIIGIRVAGLTNDSSADPTQRVRGDIYLPSASAPGSQPDSPWVNSSLTTAQLNDIITHAENLALGDEGKQIALDLFLSRKRVGDSTYFQIRTWASGYALFNTVVVTLQAAPKTWDYPHYALYAFPWSDLSQAANFFNFPFMQDPFVAGSNPINPANPVPTIPVL